MMQRSGFNRAGRVLATAVLLLALSPAAALAQRDQAERDFVDARLEGYPTSVTLKPAGDAMSWIALLVLGALCVGGLFKDAKRSHLDQSEDSKSEARNSKQTPNSNFEVFRFEICFGFRASDSSFSGTLELSMKNRLLWALVGLNVLLLITLVGRFSSESQAVAQAARRPSDYIMIPGEVSGGSGAVVYIIDTSAGMLGAGTFDSSSNTIHTMPPIDLSRVFESAPTPPRGGPAAPGGAPGARDNRQPK
jgi:hypothetical protein